MANFTIFYSWQMDVSLEENKKFILKALEAAVEELGANEQGDSFGIVEADRLAVDEGMKGVPGSPEVASMMFDKIGESAIFVGDVSLVGTVMKGQELLKRVPNPNVSIEEGFAAGVLGWERVICVSNEHYGENEEQAFDQRNRRFPISYKLKPNATKAQCTKAAKRLKECFVDAIDTVSKYEIRKAEKLLGRLNITTIEFLASYRGVLFLVKPSIADPQSPIPWLKDLTLWDRCLARLQDLHIVRTDLGIDNANQPRYAYHWTAAGRKVVELIIKKTTPAAAV